MAETQRFLTSSPFLHKGRGGWVFGQLYRRGALIPFGMILAFVGVLFWARAQDPYSRQWFTLTSESGSFKCVVVLPKQIQSGPVIVCAGDSVDALLKNGNDFRQMAELGVGVISCEYNQTNEVTFAQQMEAVQHYLSGQKWVHTNEVAWVGFGRGADQMLALASNSTNRQPDLLIILNGSELLPSLFRQQSSDWWRGVPVTNEGGKDNVFVVVDTKRLTAVLQTNRAAEKLETADGFPGKLEPERGIVFRSIGEYCLTSLAGKDAWHKYHSVTQWRAEAPGLWLFCLPAFLWILGGLDYRISTLPKKNGSQRRIIVIRWVLAALGVWILAETVIHLGTPQFLVNKKTLSITRRFLLRPQERLDFEYLAVQPIWSRQKLKNLLDQVKLARYNRGLVNWQLDDKVYRDFVLSPIITDASDEILDWRRPLWEEFYPRIRHEWSMESAARIVVQHLRERVTVLHGLNLSCSVADIWLRQLTDEAGFEIIYVAALRSVGVPADLDAKGRAEIFNGEKWLPAPRPIVLSTFYDDF